MRRDANIIPQARRGARIDGRAPVHKSTCRGASPTRPDSLVDLRVRPQRNNEEGEKEAVVVRKIMNPTSASSNRPLRGSPAATLAALCGGVRRKYGRRRVDADGDPRGWRRGPGRPRVRRRGGVRRRREGQAQGPALLNAEQVLEGAIVGGSSPPRARATVVLDEGAAALMVAEGPAAPSCDETPPSRRRPGVLRRALRERGVEFDLMPARLSMMRVL